MAARFWTCQRQVKGKKCGYKNPSRKRLCTSCGKARPARKKPAHMKVLSERPYEDWAREFGEDCNICGAKAKTRRLARDHDHITGAARGILCIRCNRALPSWITPAWLRRAADYLERAAKRS